MRAAQSHKLAVEDKAGQHAQAEANGARCRGIRDGCRRRNFPMIGRQTWCEGMSRATPSLLSPREGIPHALSLFLSLFQRAWLQRLLPDVRPTIRTDFAFRERTPLGPAVNYTLFRSSFWRQAWRTKRNPSCLLWLFCQIRRNVRPVRSTGSVVCGELMDRPVEWKLEL
jgi:hypothetical protein